MTFLYKLSSMFSVLAIASTASAAPLQKQQSPSSSLPKSGVLIASPFRKELSPAYQKRKKLMDMLVLQMEVSDMAAEAMASEDPEIKQLAQEMMDASDKVSARILDMLDPLDPPHRNPR